MFMNPIAQGIIIGGAGGASAGIIFSLFKFCFDKIAEKIHRQRIYNWLRDNTKDEAGRRFRSTKAIASWNNFTEDRVRYLCSIDKRIYLSTGPKEDMWGIYERDDTEKNLREVGI
jgi:hypothetical protein